MHSQSIKKEMLLYFLKKIGSVVGKYRNKIIYMGVIQKNCGQELPQKQGSCFFLCFVTINCFNNIHIYNMVFKSYCLFYYITTKHT